MSLDQSFKQIHEIKTLQSFQLATAVVIVYEHIITFDQEFELVWKKRYSHVKALYLLNRYVGGAIPLGNALVFLSNPRSAEVRSPRILPCCPLILLAAVYVFLALVVASNKYFHHLGRSWAWFQAIAGFVAIWAMQGIMQLRVLAMCKPYPSPFKIPIPYILGAAFVIQAILMSVILGFSYAHLLSLPVVFQTPNMSICAPSNINYLWAIWIPSAAFESVLAVFVLWVAGKHMKFTKGLSSNQDDGRTAIWTVLLRDSILYPLITVSLYITNAILWSTLPPELVQIPEAFVSCAACILGSRLVLNLRETYYMPFSDEVNIASECQSNPPLNHSYSPEDELGAPAPAPVNLDDVEIQ